MKMEYGGGGAGNKTGWVEMFRPGEMPAEVEEEVNRFLFPENNYSDATARRTEIQINNQYSNRATVFVFIKKKKILATCRIIAKITPRDALPIEASTVTAITDQSFISCLTIDSPFSAARFPDTLPSCELAGLRAIDTDRDPEVTARERYKALSAVLFSSESEALRQGFKAGFITCIGTQNLKNLYEERFGFKEIAEVSYGDSVRWKALFRSR